VWFCAVELVPEAVRYQNRERDAPAARVGICSDAGCPVPSATAPPVNDESWTQVSLSGLPVAFVT